MKTTFNIHKFKPMCDKTLSYDFIIKTIDYVINDTKLFERFTKDFFFYKDMCKKFIIYRVCNPSVETMVANSVFNEDFNRKQNPDTSDNFIENLKQIIPNAENFIDLIRYIFGYYYLYNLIKLYDDKHLWNVFYNDYYSKYIDNTFYKTRAMNINYFTEKPIEDCITSSMINFFKTQKDEIKEIIKYNKNIIGTIPFVQVIKENGKHAKYSINNILETLHTQCITNTSNNTTKYNNFLIKAFTKILIKATKEIFVHKLIDDLKNPKNKRVNSIINDISLCYVRNANYLNNYISEGLKTFIDSIERLINISPRYVNKVELSKSFERNDKLNEKISKAMAPYHVMNTKINAIEPSVAEMTGILNDIDISKVNRFNGEYITSYNTEYLENILSDIMINIEKLNYHSSGSKILFDIKKKISELAMNSNDEITFNEHHFMCINNLINTAISVYIGDHRYGDIFEYSENNWKLKFNEEFCNYTIFNSFEEEYLKIAPIYNKSFRTAVFTLINDFVKYDSINEWVYNYILNEKCFTDLKEKCDLKDLKEICDMVVKFLEESFEIIEEIKRLENKIITEYSKYYSRVHTLALCLAKIDLFTNIKRNVYDRHNIINGNDFAEDF